MSQPIIGIKIGITEPKNIISISSGWRESHRSSMFLQSKEFIPTKQIKNEKNPKIEGSLKLNEDLEFEIGSKLQKDYSQSKKIKAIIPENRQNVIDEDGDSKLIKGKFNRQSIPIQFDQVRERHEILEDLKDLLPINKKKHKIKQNPKNQYVLLAVKPTVEEHQLLDKQRIANQEKKIELLTERTRNQLILISQNSQDKKFTSTFYNDKHLKQIHHFQAFKNEVIKPELNQNGNESIIYQNEQRKNLNQSSNLIKFATHRAIYQQQPETKGIQHSKLTRYVKNNKTLESLKTKLNHNKSQQLSIIKAFIKLHLSEDKDSIAIETLSINQIDDLASVIKSHGFEKELIANFEIKDLIRHGLGLENLFLKDSKQRININSNLETFYPSLYNCQPGTSQSQINISTLGQIKPIKVSQSESLINFQRTFLQKRKKVVDNIDRYKREFSEQRGIIVQNNELTPRTQENKQSFLKQYIEQSKATMSNEIKRFPSIEIHHIKQKNQFSPSSFMIENKSLAEALIKQANQEKVYRRNKLVLEKLIYERQKQKDEQGKHTQLTQNDI